MAFTIPNRPFATEPITGFMMPDGIFEASMGKQTLNAHVKNTGAADTNVQVYVESVSDPGIVITPVTHFLANAQGGVSHLFSWEADLSAATPGEHLVSFIIETAAGDQRVIKKIFVAKASYDPSDGSFSIACPEGVLKAKFRDMVRPRGPVCCRRPKEDDCHCACDGKEDQKPTTATTTGRFQNPNANIKNTNILDYLVRGFQGHDPKFEFCLPEYLPKDVKFAFTPTPAYKGQYGDLPFQDPWLKALFCVLMLLLLIAAAIAEAVDGSGSITVSGGSSGGGSDPSDPGSCCGVGASGGGTSYVAAGLLAAAAVAGILAGASGDTRDSFRLGADNTSPADPNELTTSEELELKFKYIEPIELGKPFKVTGDWKYTRTTDMGTYSHAQTDTTANVHLLSHYEIKAPDTVLVYKREQFIIEASFFDKNKKQFKGDQLFVQCFLIGPNGQWRKIAMQDNGMPMNADQKANDGVYTGRHFFSSNDKGLWTYFVIAQDVNNAQPDMEPEEAAQIVGGMVLTNQLTITFDGGECKFVPDGHVNVIAP